MGLFRALQIGIAVLMLFGSTCLVRVVGMAASPAGSSTTWLTSSDALAGVLLADNNGGDNGGDNSDGDNGSNSNQDDNDNSFDDNDNFGNLDFPPPSSSSSSSNRPPEPQCSPPGQDTVFTSHDGKASL